MLSPKISFTSKRAFSVFSLEIWFPCFKTSIKSSAK